MDIVGVGYAVLGGALAAIGGGLGSTFGVSNVGMTAAGVVTEDPEKFGKTLILQALPGTQGIYGFLTCFMVLSSLQRVGLDKVTPDAGKAVLIACLPVAIVCFVSAIYQGKVAVSGVGIVAKRPEAQGAAIIYPAMVETFAIVSLLTSILLIQQVFASL
jgi:V/A-type H+-transporting ATPase subunit K